MPYAIVQDGQAVELDPLATFVTHQLRVSSAFEAAWTNTPIGDYATVETLHPAGALLAYTPDDLARFRIWHDEGPAPPEGEVLTYVLDVEAGEISATWGSTLPPVPAKVSAMQLKQALLQLELLDLVEAAVAGGPRALQIYFAETSEFHRIHPELVALATALGKTAEEIDQVFRLAATIL